MQILNIVNKAMMISNNCIVISLVTLFLFSCSKDNNEQDTSYHIVANSEDKEYYIWFNDSTKDVYNFHPNRKLSYYVSRANGKMNGEAIYFYDNGNIETIINFNNGRRQGIAHIFYLSGNIKSTKYYEDDSLRGYMVEYYDKYNYKKAEYLASPYAKQGYVYKRTYDSTTQKVKSILDHRHIELEKHTGLRPKDLKLPWETDEMVIQELARLKNDKSQ
jgi:antitoxin component YwqK of YwqJK toxin-antitoxin module